MKLSLKYRLCLLMYLQFFVWGSWYVTAGTYFLETLQFSGREVGLIYGSSAIAALVSPFLTGYLADRYFSIEKILTVLQFFGGIMLYVLAHIDQFVYFYPAILLYMLIFLPSFSLTNSISFYHLTDTKTDFPRVRVFGTIAWITAGLLIGSLDIEHKNTPMLIASGCSFILGLYSLTLPSSKPSISKSKTIKEVLLSEELHALFHDRGFKVMVISLALICIPAAYYYSFVNPFLNEIGVNNAAGKMALGQLTEILVMVSLPVLFRMFSLRWIIFTGLFCWGIRYLFLTLGASYNSEWLCLLAVSLHGFAYVFAILSAQILIDIRVPSELRSTAQGFFSLVTLGMGAFLGSYFAGETVQFYDLGNGLHDWPMIWFIPGVFGLFVAFLFLIRYKRISVE